MASCLDTITIVWPRLNVPFTISGKKVTTILHCLHAGRIEEKGKPDRGVGPVFRPRVVVDRWLVSFQRCLLTRWRGLGACFLAAHTYHSQASSNEVVTRYEALRLPQLLHDSYPCHAIVLFIHRSMTSIDEQNHASVLNYFKVNLKLVCYTRAQQKQRSHKSTPATMRSICCLPKSVIRQQQSQ